jgi:hypothetical protein
VTGERSDVAGALGRSLHLACCRLSVLSASTIALALLADATGFGPQTTTLALVLLPVVLFLGIAAHGRLVATNREEVELVLAMNRLRHAYLKVAPALGPYVTTGHHDDEQGLAASYLTGGRRLRRSGQFLVNTPTIVATVDAALAAAIVVLVVRRPSPPRRSPWGRGGGVPGRVGGAVLAATPRPGPAAPDDDEVPHPARPSLNDVPVRQPRSSQWSPAAIVASGGHASHVKPTPKTL